MTESGIAKVRNTPICEVPAQALRIAASFAALKTPNFDGVSIRPGTVENEVTLLAASGAKAVQVTCQGTCKRAIALPTKPLRAVLQRDSDAQHVVVVEAEAGVSVRTYSETTTVSCLMPETIVSFQMPIPETGPCEVSFDRSLMKAVLKDLEPIELLEIEPFSTGLSLSGRAERFVVNAFAVHALVAGFREAPDESRA